MQCGLLGKKLAHSYSPQIHREFADYAYALYELASPSAVENFLRGTPCAGLNVTIPYKETVIPFCRELSATAQRIGAVNTLKKTPAGWFGDNTDYAGITALFNFHALDPRGKPALILGSGGAAKTARAALADLGASAISIVSRGGAVNYQNVYERAETAIIVNATPVGMYPENANSPLDLSRFPHLAGAVDLIYNPAKTRFLAQAEKLGVPNAGGMLMLVAQAARAAEIFSDTQIAAAAIRAAYEKISFRVKNLVLIGMPGCGKSTLGKNLARRLDRELLDTDALIAQRAGQEIPAIFATRGEKIFRDYESEIIAETGKLSGKIIATGGGAVLREINRENLRQNAAVIYLETPLEKLATRGRPLSNGGNREQTLRALRAMFAERDPLYRQTADLTVERDRALGKILAMAP